ncbi:MAG: host attachment protein [Porticoccaceae bacterium]|nr:host attachment protein [Porticoccaceae bacterium]
MKSLWILVADSSRAKIYEAGLTLETITETRDLIHGQSAMAERDLTADVSGSNRSSGSGSRHHFEPHTGIKEQETVNFAREINSILDQGRRQGSYEKLVLVAAPDFLGQLRAGMNPQVHKLVVHEVDKNIVKQPLEDLRRVLPKTFFSNMA